MEKFYYSESAGNFIKRGSQKLPDAAVYVKESEYRTLIKARSSGKLIDANLAGFPVLVDPVISEDDQIQRHNNPLERFIERQEAKQHRWVRVLMLSQDVDDLATARERLEEIDSKIREKRQELRQKAQS